MPSSPYYFIVNQLYQNRRVIQDNFSENLEITLMDSVTSVADGVLKLLVALLLRLQVRAPPRPVLHSDEVAEKKEIGFIDHPARSLIWLITC